MEGRREPVTGLRRHPLINPIFPWKPRVSAPFARGNLHLVILCFEKLNIRIQPLVSPFSIVNLLR
jgi:hypothetical protein